MTARAVSMVAIVQMALLVCGDAPSAETTAPVSRDHWAALRAFAGEWEGRSEGKAGAGTVRRSYAFVLRDRFLHEKNVSTYPSQDANRTGEVHEHWSLFSHDTARQVVVLRQFHQEGFVNQYVLNAQASGPGRLVFDSESFENFDQRWRARETYEFRSADEFVETFELAAPGKELEIYSRNYFRRATPSDGSRDTPPT